jgi:hypothetical protein
MAGAGARRAAWNQALLRDGVAAAYAQTLLRAAEVIPQKSHCLHGHGAWCCINAVGRDHEVWHVTSALQYAKQVLGPTPEYYALWPAGQLSAPWNLLAEAVYQQVGALLCMNVHASGIPQPKASDKGPAFLKCCPAPSSCV